MYEQFYNLTRLPFANIPDPEFVFLSPQHRQALSILQYALIARAGFCVITGDIGAGKTTLVRRVLQTLDQQVHVGLVTNTQCETFEELLQWILLAFELEYRGKTKVEMYDEFVQFLIARHRAGYPVTLIIDEAQNLGITNLEQLRMLSNVNTEKGQILQTILVGQPELWDLLRDPKLQQFAQRISYEYFLKPLESCDLVRDYVRYRIDNAGGDPDIFEEETYPAIWTATGGVPRLINLLCDTALIYGYGEGEPNIGLATVARVIIDKQGAFGQNFNERAFRTEGSKLHSKQRRSTAANQRAGMSTIERAAQRKRDDH
jgi:general secretion pathway protein A